MQTRERILHRIADSLQANEDEILEANKADVKAFAGKIDDQLMQRLKMEPSKITSLVTGELHLAKQWVCYNGVCSCGSQQVWTAGGKLVCFL